MGLIVGGLQKETIVLKPEPGSYSEVSGKLSYTYFVSDGFGIEFGYKFLSSMAVTIKKYDPVGLFKETALTVGMVTVLYSNELPNGFTRFNLNVGLNYTMLKTHEDVINLVLFDAENES